MAFIIAKKVLDPVNATGRGAEDGVGHLVIARVDGDGAIGEQWNGTAQDREDPSKLELSDFDLFPDDENHRLYAGPSMSRPGFPATEGFATSDIAYIPHPTEDRNIILDEAIASGLGYESALIFDGTEEQETFIRYELLPAAAHFLNAQDVDYYNVPLTGEYQNSNSVARYFLEQITAATGSDLTVSDYFPLQQVQGADRDLFGTTTVTALPDEIGTKFRGYVVEDGRSDDPSSFGSGTSHEIAGGFGEDVIFGNAGDDTLKATDIYEFSWNDSWDRLSGGTGNDRFEVVLRDTELARTQYPNVVWGGPGADTISLDLGEGALGASIFDFKVYVLNMPSLTKAQFENLDLSELGLEKQVDWSRIDLVVVNPDPEDRIIYKYGSQGDFPVELLAKRAEDPEDVYWGDFGQSVMLTPEIAYEEGIRPGASWVPADNYDGHMMWEHPLSFGEEYRSIETAFGGYWVIDGEPLGARPEADQMDFQADDGGILVTPETMAMATIYPFGPFVLNGRLDGTSLVASGGVAHFTGTIADDVLEGTSGDDIFTSSPGSDAIRGGLGSDRVSYAGSDDGVSLSGRFFSAPAPGTSEGEMQDAPVSRNAGFSGSGGDAEGDTIRGVFHLSGSDHEDVFDAGAFS